jgi:hypothetical protein
MERRINSTVTLSAAMEPTSNAGNRLKSCVNSTVKTTAVSGARIVPAIMDAMPNAAQTPGSPTGIQVPTKAPSAPPIINSGANTPPEVPEPSAIAQTSALAAIKPAAPGPGMAPRSSA